MRRQVGFVLLLVSCVAVTVLLYRSAPAEPIYEGKPVGQWLDSGFEDAARVLYDVGPPAAQSIFEKLKREHAAFGRWGRYRSVWEKLPAFCRKFLPRPRNSGFDEWRASQLLLAIGPQVIPSLKESLADPHFLVRTVSAQALGLFRQRGNKIQVAIPALEAALRDSDPAVREQAAFALGIPLAANRDWRRVTTARR